MLPHTNIVVMPLYWYTYKKYLSIYHFDCRAGRGTSEEKNSVKYRPRQRDEKLDYETSDQGHALMINYLKVIVIK